MKKQEDSECGKEQQRGAGLSPGTSGTIQRGLRWVKRVKEESAARQRKARARVQEQDCEGRVGIGTRQASTLLGFTTGCRCTRRGPSNQARSRVNRTDSLQGPDVLVQRLRLRQVLLRESFDRGQGAPEKCSANVLGGLESILSTAGQHFLTSR